MQVLGRMGAAKPPPISNMLGLTPLMSSQAQCRVQPPWHKGRLRTWRSSPGRAFPLHHDNHRTRESHATGEKQTEARATAHEVATSTRHRRSAAGRQGTEVVPLQKITRLEAQATLAGAIRERLDAAVVRLAVAVEEDLIDALGKGALSEALANGLGRGDVATV